jgi:hypothetical protein
MISKLRVLLQSHLTFDVRSSIDLNDLCDTKTDSPKSMNAMAFLDDPVTFDLVPCGKGALALPLGAYFQ